VVPPTGRHVVVSRTTDAVRALSPLGESIAALGISGSRAWMQEVAAALPKARVSEPGRMQKPPFDGAVDRRAAPVIV
jgi:hypothetical protein